MAKTSIHPEQADRLTKATTAGLLLVAVSQAMSAANHVLPSTLLSRASDVVMFVGAVIVIWSYFRLTRSADCADEFAIFDSESFVMRSFQKSCMIGFMFGFGALNMLNVMDDKILAPYAPEFFIQTALAVMLGAVGISFFIINREPAAPKQH